ncbi:arabinose-5-phosphate isomerase [Granulicella aggregans]|uniref:Arabinose-5-phosphate isomerase n=1 Tax=Granulicella aggregans TaxID=474949 RepID=A0A7W7ZA15_9BACT|nr:KpsF/GutQ family sugar-phosphate isomerase [Granulicella aggregans]MBB5055511.1 arabinose-5-phosphate isomerase [Granulicella aggregans]
MSSSPSDLVRVEARALLSLAERLDSAMSEPFARAVDLLAACCETKHRVILLGVGKSGLIARKIAATLTSTGTPALFLHPAEALHGDLGIITPGDIAIALSASGETEEILRLIPVFKRLGVPLISFAGALGSTLAAASQITLDTSITEEACALNLAPTASTTVMLALGDALAIEVSRRRNFQPEDFANLHPGGHLGRRLTPVRDLMHSGEALPHVSADTPMTQVIYEMSRKKLGMTTVLSNDRLLGIVSDGDLRRLLEREGPHALEHTAAEIMNPHPVTIAETTLAPAALALMEQKKITSLIVTDAGTREVLGVVHLHDIWALEIA